MVPNLPRRRPEGWTGNLAGMDSPRPTTTGLGVVIGAEQASTAIEMIGMAEQAGVEAVWLTAGRLRPDPLTIMGAASQVTRRVKMGAAVVPIWPRHPLAVAQQIGALESLAAGRIRLGLGPSTAAAMSVFGAAFHRPLHHLREYVTVLRTLFREGGVDFRGDFVRARGSIPSPLPTPVLASALRPGAFRLCGEATDGAITWVCPPRFVKDTGLPALRSGASSKNRAAPPIVLCVPTLVTEDAGAVQQAAQQYIAMYTRFQYYREMFTMAGHPPQDGRVSPALVEDLVVHGSMEQVAARLSDLATWSEVMVLPLTGGLEDRSGFERCLETVARACGK